MCCKRNPVCCLVVTLATPTNQLLTCISHKVLEGLLNRAVFYKGWSYDACLKYWFITEYYHQSDLTFRCMWTYLAVIIPWAVFKASSKRFLFRRIPKDWKDVGRVHPKEELHLTFVLKQQNIDLLERTLALVSDPDSAYYGKVRDRAVQCSPHREGYENSWPPFDAQS